LSFNKLSIFISFLLFSCSSHLIQAEEIKPEAVKCGVSRAISENNFPETLTIKDKKFKKKLIEIRLDKTDVDYNLFVSIGLRGVKGFKLDFDKMILIGSDTPDITDQIISQGFAELDKHDIIIGPAQDGGFYLIGMKKPHENLLNKRTYGHEKVLNELLDEIENRNLSVFKLPTLIDIDVKDDLKKAGIEIVFED